mmetsp:Transcript_34260/g.79158  ORF Transcript_34260/g.79158 Transcript_34260/m.79158 type:complete len:220 (-) Transcript_34260:14-673(-)
MLGVEVKVRVVRHRVELGVHESDYLGRLVVDNRAIRLVPEDRHREFVRGACARNFVECAHIRGLVHHVRDHTRVRDRAHAAWWHDGRVVLGAEDPAFVFVLVWACLSPGGMDDREADRALETLELAHDQRAVGPRACVRDIQMVPAREVFRLDRRQARGAELAVSADEGAGLRHLGQAVLHGGDARHGGAVGAGVGGPDAEEERREVRDAEAHAVLWMD